MWFYATGQVCLIIGFSLALMGETSGRPSFLASLLPGTSPPTRQPIDKHGIIPLPRLSFNAARLSGS